MHYSYLSTVQQPPAADPPSDDPPADKPASDDRARGSDAPPTGRAPDGFRRLATDGRTTAAGPRD
jgi:hypothetical protein